MQLAVLICAAGSIYPLIYLRQNFELSLLDTLGIGLTELSECYAILGLTFFLAYLPSGVLADRFDTKGLVLCSLIATAGLGFWFSTFPELVALKLIFLGWGLSSGLTFWAALIKIVEGLANPNEQGRYFGLLEGGRGLVEALLATLAVVLFSSLLSREIAVSIALERIIYVYIAFILVQIPAVYFLLDDRHYKRESALGFSRLVKELKGLLSNGRLWLCAFCILTAYQIFWATYSFSAYLQEVHSFSAVLAASLTVAKLWMRPIGAVLAGFVGDFSGREYTVAFLLFAASGALALVAVLPPQAGMWLLFATVLLIGFLSYALRGIYWSTLQQCGVSNSSKGLAIGTISVIGFTPDIYLPLANSALLTSFPGAQGYSLYFLSISACGIIGGLAAVALSKKGFSDGK